MFGITGSITISSRASLGYLYTDNNKAIMGVSTQSSKTINTTDFSGTIYSNGSTTSITIKKAGKYEVNDNGNISTANYSSGTTITKAQMFDTPQKYYYIRKIG